MNTLNQFCELFILGFLIHDQLVYYDYFLESVIVILPYATSCGGFNVFYPFVSQSVLFFLSAQLLWNR